MSAARSYRALPVAKWPTFDSEAWLKANEAGDEFLEQGIASQWAPRSRENAELAYGRFLGFLLREGRLGEVQRIGDRVELRDLLAFGYELSSQLAPYTVCGIFASLGMAIKAMDPKANRRHLNQIISRLDQTKKSVRDIGSNLLTPIELVKIGEEMMEEAEKQQRQSWRRASRYRDGLLTMFMALCPLRPGAVSELQIGTSVIVEGDGVAIRLQPARRKKRRLEDVPLPDDLVRRLLRYISYYRRMFPAPAPAHTNALWLSRNGRPLDRDSLSKRIKERLGRRTGKRFSAHMFRHASASYIVDVAPAQARMVVGVLGHSGFRTAQKHYIKGQQHIAVRSYQRAVADLVKRVWFGRRKRGGRRK